MTLSASHVQFLLYGMVRNQTILVMTPDMYRIWGDNGVIYFSFNVFEATPLALDYSTITKYNNGPVPEFQKLVDELQGYLDVLPPVEGLSNFALETGGNLDDIKANLETINSLIPSKFDYVEPTYTGEDLIQVVYKIGGSGGTVVATIQMTYISHVLQTVAKV